MRRRGSRILVSRCAKGRRFHGGFNYGPARLKALLIGFPPSGSSLRRKTYGNDWFGTRKKDSLFAAK